MKIHEATDHIDESLQTLIAEEPDQGKRANLLVLSAMALNLSVNTMALNALSGEIHDHKREFKEHRETFRNHKVLVYAMSVVVTLVFVGAVWVIHNYHTLFR
jgi:uncharacterized protein YggU (UPF0235/DUF167 family)